MDDCRPGICHHRCWRGIEPAKITIIATPASATATNPENSAIITCRKFLGEKGASAGNIDTRIREFISPFKDVRRYLRDSAPDVPERQDDAEAARKALEASKPEDARLLLATPGNNEGEGGVCTLPKDFLTKTFFLWTKTV